MSLLTGCLAFGVFGLFVFFNIVRQRSTVLLYLIVIRNNHKALLAYVIIQHLQAVSMNANEITAGLLKSIKLVRRL